MAKAEEMIAKLGGPGAVAAAKAKVRGMEESRWVGEGRGVGRSMVEGCRHRERSKRACRRR